MYMYLNNASAKQMAILWICLMVLVRPSVLYGQYAYGLSFRGPGNVGTPYVALFDLNECNMCPIKDLPMVGQDLFTLPNGDVMVLLNSPNANPRYSYFETYSFPDTTPVSVSPNLTGRWFKSILEYNGEVYMTYLDSLYTIDLNTFQVTPIPGAIPLPAPPGMGTIIFRLFEYNGGLYGVYSPNSGNVFIVQIDPTDPSASTLYGTVSGMTNNLFTDVSILGGQHYISGIGLPTIGRGVHVLSMTPPAAAPIVCQAIFIKSLPPYPPALFPIAPYGLVEAPANHPFFPCICANLAGSILVSPSNRCIGNNQLTVTVLAPGIPANGDIIRYLVVTDTSDLSGSLVVSSSSATITIPPALIVPNVPYFIVMAVGENSGGSVNLADPCLKLSNFQVVTWRPLPSVALSAANPNVCPSNCTEVTAAFTGTPPFTLTYSASGLSPTTQTFTSDTGVFPVCLPANIPIGNWTISATALTDAFCTCQ